MKYRYRISPLFEAWHWTPPTFEPMPDWVVTLIEVQTLMVHHEPMRAMLKTSDNGIQLMWPGDWLVRHGTTGAVNAMTDPVFTTVYVPLQP